MDRDVTLRGELLEPHPLARLERLVLRQAAGGNWREVTVTVREGQLVIDGEPFPRSRHVAGYAIAGSDGDARVVLTDTEHRVETELKLASPDRARELLEALGLTPDRLAVPFVAVWISGMVIAFALFIFAISLALSAWAISWLNLIPAALLLTLGAMVMRASRYPFIVAPDGVVVRRFGGTKAMPFGAMDRVETDGDSGLRIHMNDGTSLYVDFPVKVPSMPHPVEAALPVLTAGDVNLNELVASLIEDHLARRDDDDEPLVARLCRGSRATERWLGDLRRLAQGDYRRGAPHPDQLWRVVEDGSADASARAAAARLLPTSDETDRRRLRLAADNVAAPRLRVALQTMARSEEEERDAILATLEVEGSSMASLPPPTREERAR